MRFLRWPVIKNKRIIALSATMPSPDFRGFCFNGVLNH
nr:MAG TPA: helicase [Inoviridae sp.]DAW67422.1 MAG TPA: helicase [Caudoviricetes sp.]